MTQSYTHTHSNAAVKYNYTAPNVPSATENSPQQMQFSSSLLKTTVLRGFRSLLDSFTLFQKWNYTSVPHFFKDLRLQWEQTASGLRAKHRLGQ